MSKKPDATVRVEIIPPSPRSTPVELAVLLKKLEERLGHVIEQKVARLLANRDEFVFQPFFQEKKVAAEIRRIQSIPEQRKWSLYFESFGCLICGDRKAMHNSCGMCRGCYTLVFQRLEKIIKQYRRKSEEHLDFPTDRAEMARKALAGGSSQQTLVQLKARKG
jgi:hypothetical protein